MSSDVSKVHPGAASVENGSEEPFTFCVLCDPQFGMMGGAKDWESDKEAFVAAVEGMNNLRPKPRFCVVLGDLVHHFPAMYESEVEKCEDVFNRQIMSVRSCLEHVDSDIPVFCIPGNHDVGNKPTAASIAEYKKHFGPDYYSFTTGSLRLVMLNSGLLYDSSLAETEAREQLTWLDDVLLHETERTIILMMHHPPWLEKSDEPDEISSRSNFRGHLVSNSYFHLPKKSRSVLARAMQRNGNVAAVFAGHFHQTLETETTPPVIITGATGEMLGPVDPVTGACLPPIHDPGFRICKFIPGGNIQEQLETKYFPSSVFLKQDGRPRVGRVPLTIGTRNDWDIFRESESENSAAHSSSQKE